MRAFERERIADTRARRWRGREEGVVSQGAGEPSDSSVKFENGLSKSEEVAMNFDGEGEEEEREMRETER